MMLGGSELAKQLTHVQLSRAGLTIVGEARTDHVLPPRAAWRPTMTFTSRTTIALPRNHPYLVTELNAQWHRLAMEYDVIDQNGAFLVAVADPLSDDGPSPWMQVRLSPQWDLAGTLGPTPGSPEFVTLSTHGHSLLGATTREDEIWIVAVDQLEQRRKEVADVGPVAPDASAGLGPAWTSLFLETAGN